MQTPQMINRVRAPWQTLVPGSIKSRQQPHTHTHTQRPAAPPRYHHHHQNEGFPGFGGGPKPTFITPSSRMYANNIHMHVHDLGQYLSARVFIICVIISCFVGADGARYFVAKRSRQPARGQETVCAGLADPKHILYTIYMNAMACVLLASCWRVERAYVVLLCVRLRSSYARWSLWLMQTLSH